MAESTGKALWSPESLSDLDQIWNYYERVAGRNAATKIVRQIDKVIATVEDHPFAGRARDELRAGVRSLAATPHVVFYRVVNDIPEIIRILDSRRDIDEIFSD